MFKVNSFSEENYNTLFVTSFEEVFFEVYQVKFGAEEYLLEGKMVNGLPTVNIDVEGKGKIEVVLKTGEPRLILTNKKQNIFEDTETVINSVEELPSIVPTFKFEDETIQRSPLIVEKTQPPATVEKIVVKEVVKEIKVGEQELYDYIDGQLINTRDKVRGILTNAEQLIEDRIKQQGGTLVEQFITEVDKVVPKLKSIIDQNFDKAEEKYSEFINEKLNNVITNITEFKSLVEQNNTNTQDQIQTKFESIKSDLNNLTENTDKDLKKNLENFSLQFSKLKDQNTQTITENVELLTTLVENSKQLLTTHVNEKIEDNKVQLESLIQDKNKNTKAEIDNKIKEIETLVENIKIDIVNVDNKQTTNVGDVYNKCVNLIESKIEDVIKQISSSQTVIAYESSKGTITEAKKVERGATKKDISDLNNQIAFIKRMIAESSGGGTVAVQYVNGGTMNGDLNVNGNILSGGINLSTIFSQGSGGGGVGGDAAVNSLVHSNSAYWNSSYTTLTASSAYWDSVYTTVNANSATIWNYQGTDIKALTANWQNTYTTFSLQSANNISTYTTVNVNSAYWQNTYTTVQTYSSIWTGGIQVVNNLTYIRWQLSGDGSTTIFSIPSAYSDIEESYLVTLDAVVQDPISYTVDPGNDTITFSSAPLSGSTIVVIETVVDYAPITILQTSSANWNNTYTTVNTNSASWGSGGGGNIAVNALVISNSANWNTSYQYATAYNLSAVNYNNTWSTVNANSANWNYQGTDLKLLSANWQNTYTTVSANSANWNYQGTDLKGLSANWQNTYTTVSTNSASWLGVTSLSAGNGVTLSASNNNSNPYTGAVSITIGQPVATTSNVTFNNITATGISKLTQIEETFNTYTTTITSNAIVGLDCTTGNIFYINATVNSNWTANFTNLNLNNNTASTLTLVINQGSTGYLPLTAQIGGVTQTINWQGGSIPGGNALKKDVVAFSVLNTNPGYIVLGQMITFG